MRVAVVIPAYEAEATIGEVVAGIPGWVEWIIVVDDNSSDHTWSAALASSRVVLVRHIVNQGVGAATLTGYVRARELGAEVIVKVDADGQMDPDRMYGLVNAITIDGADYVKGDRTGRRETMPRLRRLGVQVLSWWLGIPDCVNGYTAISRKASQALRTANLHPRWFFEISVLLEAKRLGLKVVNIPMLALYGEETSHLSPWRCLMTFPWLLWKYRA